MKKFFKIFLVVILIAAFLGTIVFLYKKSQSKSVVYGTQKAFVTDIIRKTVATGSVVPRKEIEIKPQVSGIIKEVIVEPGVRVKEGDLLARVKIIPNMISLNDAQVRLKKAELALTDSRRVYERQKKIYEQGVIPEAEFQRFQIEYENAKQDVEAAQNHLQLIKEGATKAAGESSNTLIRSTIDGMVLDVPVEEGNSVIEANNFNDGTTIASIADMGKMVFEGKVDESEVGKLHEGMELLLTIGAIQGTTFPATLEYIAPKGVEENGAIQFEIKADVKLLKDKFIRAGYSASADIVLERRDSVLAVPEALLRFEGDSAYVEVQQEDQVFQKQFVELGISDGINVEIIKGLSKEQEIKDPHDKKEI